MMIAKKGLVARIFGSFQPAKKRNGYPNLPVFHEKVVQKTRTAEEVKRSRVYANVPLGMD